MKEVHVSIIYSNEKSQRTTMKYRMVFRQIINFRIYKILFIGGKVRRNCVFGEILFLKYRRNVFSLSIRNIVKTGVIMTLQKTVTITKERHVHLDLPVPESIPVGKAEVRIIFASYSKPQSATKRKNTQALCGMFADIGDTTDNFLTRKRAEKELEYENE